MNSYVVVDLETTGLSYKNGDRITEIGALLVEDGIVRETFETLVNPGVHIPSYVQELTGITNQMVATAPSAEQVIPAFCKFCKKFPIVAHNAKFDSGFLEGEMRRLSPYSKIHVLCSLLLARRIFPDLNSYKLSEISNVMGFKVSSFHRAINDCNATVELMQTIEGRINSSQSSFQISPQNLLGVIATAPVYFRTHGIDKGLEKAKAIAPKNYQSISYKKIHEVDTNIRFKPKLSKRADLTEPQDPNVTKKIQPSRSLILCDWLFVSIEILFKILSEVVYLSLKALVAILVMALKR